MNWFLLKEQPVILTQFGCQLSVPGLEATILSNPGLSMGRHILQVSARFSSMKTVDLKQIKRKATTSEDFGLEIRDCGEKRFWNDTCCNHKTTTIFSFLDRWSLSRLFFIFLPNVSIYYIETLGKKTNLRLRPSNSTGRTESQICFNKLIGCFHGTCTSENNPNPDPSASKMIFLG